MYDNPLSFWNSFGDPKHVLPHIGAEYDPEGGLAKMSDFLDAEVILVMLRILIPFSCAVRNLCGRGRCASRS